METKRSMIWINKLQKQYANNHITASVLCPIVFRKLIQEKLIPDQDCRGKVAEITGIPKSEMEDLERISYQYLFLPAVSEYPLREDESRQLFEKWYHEFLLWANVNGVKIL